MKTFLKILVLFIVILMITKSCSNVEQKTIVKTEVKIVKVKDTLRIEKVIDNPVTVYVDKFKYIKQYDTLYRDSVEIVKANKYTERIVGKKGTADIEVTTTGELLDLKVIIESKTVFKEKEITKFRNKSKAFISGGFTSQGGNPFSTVNIGLDYHIKNKVLLKSSVGLDLITNKPFIGVGVGIPLN